MIESVNLETRVARDSELLAAAADPYRLRVLHLLAARGRTCVCDLQAETGLAPNLLSYHMRVLREVGLVSSTRRGRWVDYELADDALAQLRAAIPSPSDPILRPAPAACGSKS